MPHSSAFWGETTSEGKEAILILKSHFARRPPRACTYMKRPRSESAAAVDSSAPLALDALLASSVPLVFEGRASGSCWARL